MPVTVRNTRSNTIMVLSSRVKEVDAIEWAPAGDKNGEDVQQVPNSMIEQTNFLRSVALGLLKVEADDQVMMDSIAKQAKRYERTQTEAQDEIAALVDNNSQRGVIVISEADLDTHIAKLSKSQESELSTIGEN